MQVMEERRQNKAVQTVVEIDLNPGFGWTCFSDQHIIFFQRYVSYFSISKLIFTLLLTKTTEGP